MDWRTIRATLEGTLTADEDRILAMLVEGASTPAIAKVVGHSRSWVWRRMESLKERARAHG